MKEWSKKTKFRIIFALFKTCQSKLSYVHNLCQSTVFH